MWHAHPARDSRAGRPGATTPALPFFLFTFTFSSMPMVAVIPGPNAPVELREVPNLSSK